NTNKIGIIFEPPKTKNSKRKITIPLQTITALKEHKKEWSQSKLKNPDALYPDLVFVTSKHTPLLPQNFLKRFWKRVQIDVEFKMNKFEAKPMSVKQTLDDILSACRKRKDWQQLTRRNFHVIRHTYATTLLAAGVPIIDVSRSLGHARVSTTLDIYGHAIPENKQVIADEIANAFLK
ncbi:MAG: tyrosine-type recombinase/integrase, partial [Selenomonadaceae bacterium]